MTRRDRLRLLRGGRDQSGRLQSLRIEVAPPDRPPFPVDAMAAEEDTYLVLSADREAKQHAEHPIRLMTALWEIGPEQPGSIVVRDGQPLRLLAVVHDLSQEPSWREEWVAAALEGILSECSRSRLTALGLPLLGCVHGKLGRERFVLLLQQALSAAAPDTLQRLWLMAHDDEIEGVMRLLA